MNTLDRYMILSGTSPIWLARAAGVHRYTIRRWRLGYHAPADQQAIARLQEAISRRNVELSRAYALSRHPRFLTDLRCEHDERVAA